MLARYRPRQTGCADSPASGFRNWFVLQRFVIPVLVYLKGTASVEPLGTRQLVGCVVVGATENAKEHAFPGSRTRRCGLPLLDSA